MAVIRQPPISPSWTWSKIPPRAARTDMSSTSPRGEVEVDDVSGEVAGTLGGACSADPMNGLKAFRVQRRGAAQTSPDTLTSRPLPSHRASTRIWALSLSKSTLTLEGPSSSISIANPGVGVAACSSTSSGR